MFVSCREQISAINCVLEAFLIMLGQGTVRYVLFAGLVYLIVNIALAGVLTKRKIRDDSPERQQLLREFFASMRTVLVFSGFGVFVGLGVFTGLIVVHLDPAYYGWPYFVVNVVLLIVGHDTWIYWTHRWMHTKRVYHTFHGFHHRSFNPSPWTAYAFALGEAVVQGAYLPLIIFLLPSSLPAVLLFTLAAILRNVIAHCGYELYPPGKDGRPKFDWLATVTHHDLHHAQAGWNFALYFTFWDRWLGTEHPDYHRHYAVSVRAEPGKPAPA